MKRGNNNLQQAVRYWKRFWHFFWEEDSLLSWIVNIVVAFILIKWVIYPGLGLILMTSHPIVAVVSPSMEHDSLSFDRWWDVKQQWYTENNISKDEFEDFPFRNGFNKGDIMVLYGVDSVKVGQIIVFWGGKQEPIIHRVVRTWDVGGEQHFMTKGDHNSAPLKVEINGINLGMRSYIDETDTIKEDIVGKAVFRIPYLGYIKIWFVSLLQFLHLI